MVMILAKINEIEAIEKERKATESDPVKENEDQSADLYYDSDGELLDEDFKKCFECDDQIPKWIPELGVDTLKSHYYGK